MPGASERLPCRSPGHVQRLPKSFARKIATYITVCKFLHWFALPDPVQ
jgi:hypothetical protein